MIHQPKIRTYVPSPTSLLKEGPTFLFTRRLPLSRRFLLNRSGKGKCLILPNRFDRVQTGTATGDCEFYLNAACDLQIGKLNHQRFQRVRLAGLR